MAISICGQRAQILFNNTLLVNTPLCQWHGLVFLTLILVCSCNSEQQTGLSIRWNNNRATALLIPEKLVKEATADSISEWLKIVVLHDSNTTAIMGDYKLHHGVLFEPLIPFSRGLSYNVFYRNKKIGNFQIPAANPNNAPQLMAVYPSKDTLPENLLKFYLRFSQPMREGESGKHIHLIKDTDTLRDVFLNLQPELWNAERTVITIWLDPGRIKRALQPNQRLGSPLKESSTYTLLVSREWKDKQGLPLKQDFTKSFVAGKRDSLSPDPVQWILQTPKAASTQVLTIDCKEPLDYFLLKESLRILDQNGSAVEGNLTINQEENIVHFIPARPWVAGNYDLIIQSILEDLAGNNINRLFDRDIYQNKPSASEVTYRVKFRITSQATLMARQVSRNLVAKVWP